MRQAGILFLLLSLHHSALADPGRLIQSPGPSGPILVSPAPLVTDKGTAIRFAVFGDAVDPHVIVTTGTGVFSPKLEVSPGNGKLFVLAYLPASVPFADVSSVTVNGYMIQLTDALP